MNYCFIFCFAIFFFVHVCLLWLYRQKVFGGLGGESSWCSLVPTCGTADGGHPSVGWEKGLLGQTQDRQLPLLSASECCVGFCSANFPFILQVTCFKTKKYLWLLLTCPCILKPFLRALMFSAQGMHPAPPRYTYFRAVLTYLPGLQKLFSSWLPPQ